MFIDIGPKYSTFTSMITSSTATVADARRSSLAIADDGTRRSRCDARAAAAVDAARAVVDRARRRATTPVYGINTGFGSLAEVKIPRDALGALQRNLLRSHAAGVGEPLPARAVRAMMALRANVLAKGYSGIRRATLERLIEALNARVHPRRARAAARSARAAISRRWRTCRWC